MDASRPRQKTALAIVPSNGSVVFERRPPADTQVSKTFFRNEGRELDSSPPAPYTHGFTAEENEKFLHIIERCARIQRHYEIFLLTQGELQYFIPHQILISAWGDFRRRRGLTVDVISSLPGVRTERVANCSGLLQDHGMEGLLQRMHGIWRHGGRQPMVLNKPATALQASGNCSCGLASTLKNMKSIVVHGIHDKREGYDSLYLALNRSSIVRACALDRFYDMVDILIPQIEFAFRRVAALKPARTPSGQPLPRGPHNLTAREQEIMNLICKGKTNLETAAILGISANTVKNHVHRIFPKLGASNRTQAVAIYRQEVERSEVMPAE